MQSQSAIRNFNSWRAVF